MSIESKIAFVGGGNMARNLIMGMLKKGFLAKNFIVSDSNSETVQRLQDDLKVNVAQDNQAAVMIADVVVFAVKPQVMPQVAMKLSNAINAKQALVISIAAGIGVAKLQGWLNGYSRIIRTMPNLPAAIGEGITGLFANPNVSTADRELASKMFAAVGREVWLEHEQAINAIASLAGSGPAVLFYVIEAFEAAAEQLGFTVTEAKNLALQTIFGAAKMVLHSDYSAVELRKQVTSPKGITEQAIAVLKAAGVREIIGTAFLAANRRAEEISNEN